MKKITCLLFSLSLFLLVHAQEAAESTAGIQFEQLDWDATLKMAKEQDKIIFVDAYTTWCGPCKMMDKNIYPLAEVGAFYNEHFVNVKIDMEKGEGLLFAKAYKVSAYPSYLFVDSDGKLLHRGVGSQAAEAFIALGEAATDPDQQLGTQMEKFEKGERDAEFLRTYATILQHAYMQDEQKEVVDVYLKTQDNWLSSENAAFIVEMVDADMSSELFRYVIQHRKELGELAGLDKVDEKLKRAAMMELYRKHRDQLQEKAVVVATYNKVLPADAAEQYGSEFVIGQMSRAQEAEEQQKFLDAVVKHLDKYSRNTDWATLNSFAWRVYELSEDPSVLKKAKDWAKTSVEMNSNYMNTDTLAALYFKLKEKDKALEYANKAIAIAKKEGGDYSGTEKLLEQIQALQ